jgi:hypothetical protein
MAPNLANSQRRMIHDMILSNGLRLAWGILGWRGPYRIVACAKGEGGFAKYCNVIIMLLVICFW